ncbi:MAG: proline--tRNA ligase [Candidatus Micrarchaeota archaeon]
MKIQKEKNFSEWYTEILKEAELCDLRYNVKGFIVFMPWAVSSIKKMYEAYERALEARGHRPVWFPALIPEANLKKEAEHVQGFIPEVFWVTGAGDEKFEERLALRPTSETAMYPMYSLWIQGLKDLPLKLYHSSQVWRHETKATRPFIRSREFYWIETHNAFATREGAMGQVREDAEMAEEVVHQQFGIPFLFFERPQWDKFPGADSTYAADTLMPDGKVIQQPSTHLLGQNFARAFNITYANEKGMREFVWQTCYGPALSRIYASLISTHGDEKGLVLPFDLAPVQVILIPISKKGKEEKLTRRCNELAEILRDNGFRTEVDASESTPGFKFNHWEMKGVPIRIEVGEQELEKKELTLARRDTGKREKVREGELLERICALRKDILENLRKKSDEWFGKQMHSANTGAELKENLKKGGFVRVDFCSIEKDGEECARLAKEEYGGDVRGVLFEKNERPRAGAKCIFCGRDAKEVVYIARQY